MSEDIKVKVCEDCFTAIISGEDAPAETIEGMTERWGGYLFSITDNDPEFESRYCGICDIHSTGNYYEAIAFKS